MRRPAQLSSPLAARSPYWALVLLLQYLHLALGRPAPPSEEGDAPAANDDGAGGVAAKEEQKPTATAAPSTAKNEAEKSSSTATATAAWATQTSGGMQQSSDKQDTIILHSDASLSYGCPKSGDKWEQESLTDSLTAHTATGAGCWMRYTFQGDSVQVYGASGLQAGVFGCSVNSGPTNTSGWWNAYGSANFYRPYSGSCSIQGLGYDKHTIQLTNSPYQPKKVYFTGLRITTNQSQPIWETPKWEACCQKFTFPDGVATTVAASVSTGTANANGLLTGLDGSTFSFIIAAIAAVVIAAAALIAEAAFARTPPADYSAAEAESFATLVSHVFVVRKHHRWRNFSSGAQQEEICST